MYLIDTDCLSILQRQTPPEFARLRSRMGAHPREHFFLSIVSFHEQALGWTTYLSRAKDPRGTIRAYEMLALILRDFNSYPVLAFDQLASDTFEQMRQQRVRLATMDLRIASTALSRRMTVITRNTADFRKVPGLSVEDWTQ
jgi:tRNA(fMet)-specific endonuclease VapC